MLSNVYCSSDDVAGLVSQELNHWWTNLTDLQKKSYEEAVNSLCQGDQIILDEYIFIREGDGLRCMEH